MIIIRFNRMKLNSFVELTNGLFLLQTKRAELRLNGYRTLLRLVLVTDALSDTSQVALFTGYLGSMTSTKPNDATPTGAGKDLSIICVHKLLISMIHS